MIKNISYETMEYIIDQWVHNGKYREVAKKKLHNDEISYERLAEEFDISVTRAKDIVKDVRTIIYEHI